MAIAFGAAGSPNAGTTSINVTLPATINAGDLILLWVVNKYPSNGPAEPSGWTTVGLHSGGSGSAGVDSGSVYSTLFVKEANGTEGGTSQAVSIPSGNASRGMAWTITKSASMAWAWSYAVGSSPTPGNWNTTFNVNPGITAGDLLWVFSGVNGDAATSWSAESLTIPGATLGSMTERHDATTSQGDDMGMFSTSHPVSSGTATGVGTYTATRAGSTTTNSPAGASVLVRFREVTPPLTNIDPSGIASAGALGAPSIAIDLAPSGIPSAGALGSPSIVIVELSGIPSAGALGVPSVDTTLGVAGIASAEAVGAPGIAVDLGLTGIASSGAIGSPTVAPAGAGDNAFQGFQSDGFQTGAAILATGIASGEALGAPVIEIGLAPGGIDSGEALGDLAVDVAVSLPGIASSEALGVPALEVTILASGIPSAEALGAVSAGQSLAYEVYSTAVACVVTSLGVDVDPHATDFES